MHTLSRLWTLVALLLLSNAANAQPASPAELRREIDRLQAENVALAHEIVTIKTQLADAQAARDEQQARAEQLAAQVEALLQQLRTGGSQAVEPDPALPQPIQPAAPTHASVPADPLASPASLLAELQRRYTADLAPSDTNPTSPAAPLSVDRRRQIDQWAVEQAAQIQGPIEWRVRFTDFREAARRDYRALMTVIDPASGLPIGDALDVAVPRTLAERLERELTLGRDPDKAPLWTLVGTIAAAPKLNPDRPTPGVFNHPAFVGPYVEFDFHLSWRNVFVLPSTP